MSTEVVEAEFVSDYDTAHDRAARIKELIGTAQTSLDEVQHVIATAYSERDWEALGYDTWADYVTKEFDVHKVRLPKADRASIAQALKDSGLSTRAIASALGVSQSTARREVTESDDSGESEFADAPTGLDGKPHTTPNPVVAQLGRAVTALTKVEKLMAGAEFTDDELAAIIEHKDKLTNLVVTVEGWVNEL